MIEILFPYIKGSMTHLQNIVWGLKINKVIATWKKFMMGNYGIVVFIAIMQRLTDIQFFLKRLYRHF